MTFSSSGERWRSGIADGRTFPARLACKRHRLMAALTQSGHCQPGLESLPATREGAATASQYYGRCPAASTINWAISSGWEISERWLAFTSIVLAPMRLAMKRSRSGLIVRSSVETA